jgi:GNAT superfamily N-acetyltransferase
MRSLRGHRQPNSTPHADARASAVLCFAHQARAGERGRWACSGTVLASVAVPKPCHEGTRMNLRRPGKKDSKVFRDFVVQLYNHIRDSTKDPYLQANEEWFIPGYEQWFDTKVRWDRGLVVFAEDPAPVGFVAADLRPPEFGSDKVPLVGVIALIWIEESHRKKGVATSLVAAAEDWFREKEIPYAEVPYTVGTPGARELWAAVGYAEHRIVCRKSLSL